MSIVPPGAMIGTAPSNDAAAASASAKAKSRSAPRRFLLGLLTMGIVVALPWLYYVVGHDLPDDSGARTWAPHLLGAPLIALFFGLPLAVGVAVGWAWRGACERARNMQRDRREKCRGDRRQPSIGEPSLPDGTWARIR